MLALAALCVNIYIFQKITDFMMFPVFIGHYYLPTFGCKKLITLISDVHYNITQYKYNNTCDKIPQSDGGKCLFPRYIK